MTSTASNMSTDEKKSLQRPAQHVTYLDGLRGLSALYVTLFHFYTPFMGIPELQFHPVLPLWLAFATAWLAAGHQAVAIFIVLSGYCLGLPIARSADHRLKGGAKGYLIRRARRILSPYYAALIASVAYWCLIGRARDISKGSMLAHLLLLHNLRLGWSHNINAPMWSVATEWQIYFLLPFMLMPMYKRFGLRATSITAVILGVGLGFVHLPHGVAMQGAGYIGLFALGVAAAYVTECNEPKFRSFFERMPWRNLCIAACVITVAASPILVTVSSLSVLLDYLYGCAALTLIVYCAREIGEKRRPLVLRLLEHPATVALGGISYSLYLTHIIVKHALLVRINPFGLTGVPAFMVFLVGGTLLSVIVASVFWFFFERPFVTNRSRSAPV